jgi:hypothetical protein
MASLIEEHVSAVLQHTKIHHILNAYVREKYGRFVHVNSKCEVVTSSNKVVGKITQQGEIVTISFAIDDEMKGTEYWLNF